MRRDDELGILITCATRRRGALYPFASVSAIPVRRGPNTASGQPVGGAFGHSVRHQRSWSGGSGRARRTDRMDLGCRPRERRGEKAPNSKPPKRNHRLAGIRPDTRPAIVVKRPHGARLARAMDKIFVAMTTVRRENGRDLLFAGHPRHAPSELNPTRLPSPNRHGGSALVTCYLILVTSPLLLACPALRLRLFPAAGVPCRRSGSARRSRRVSPDSLSRRAPRPAPRWTSVPRP